MFSFVRHALRLVAVTEGLEIKKTKGEKNSVFRHSVQGLAPFVCKVILTFADYLRFYCTEATYLHLR